VINGAEAVGASMFAVVELMREGVRQPLLEALLRLPWQVIDLGRGLNMQGPR
jgi:hypothetical protein